MTMKKVTFACSGELLKEIEDLANKRGVTRSTFCRDACDSVIIDNYTEIHESGLPADMISKIDDYVHGKEITRAKFMLAGCKLLFKTINERKTDGKTKKNDQEGI